MIRMNPMLHALGQQFALSLRLMLDRRALFFIIADLLIVFFAVLAALLGDGSAKGLYSMVVLMPYLLLAVPILSDVVALERRSGTLDLAMASSGRFYFERRIGAFCIVMLAQGWLVILLSRTLHPFHLVPALVQTFLIVAFLGTAVFFWSVRVRGSGGVAIATLLTTVVFAKWFFANAVHIGKDGSAAMEPQDILDWAQRNLVLASASFFLYLYAIQRASRPEKLIS